MIFAAGLGTRLRPLTDDLPKALVPVAGVPMLERVALRLVEAGADRLIINVHHFADRIADFVRERDGFGAECVISREPERRLETGGGLLAAASHFRRDAPFFIHNSDVLTGIDLERLYRAHRESDALVTLAVMRRHATRDLLFDRLGLCGRTDAGGDSRLVREPDGEVEPLGFSGVHVASPELLERIEERGVFSIIWPYLRLAGEGEPILPHRVDDALWLDIGTHERLAEAERVLARR